MSLKQVQLKFTSEALRYQGKSLYPHNVLVICRSNVAWKGILLSYVDFNVLCVYKYFNIFQTIINMSHFTFGFSRKLGTSCNSIATSHMFNSAGVWRNKNFWRTQRPNAPRQGDKDQTIFIVFIVFLGRHLRCGGLGFKERCWQLPVSSLSSLSSRM